MSTILLNGREIPSVIPLERVADFFPSGRFFGLSQVNPVTKRSTTWRPKYTDSSRTKLDLRPESNDGASEYRMSSAASSSSSSRANSRNAAAAAAVAPDDEDQHQQQQQQEEIHEEDIKPLGSIGRNSNSNSLARSEKSSKRGDSVPPPPQPEEEQHVASRSQSTTTAGPQEERSGSGSGSGNRPKPPASPADVDRRAHTMSYLRGRVRSEAAMLEGLPPGTDLERSDRYRSGSNAGPASSSSSVMRSGGGGGGGRGSVRGNNSAANSRQGSAKPPSRGSAADQAIAAIVAREASAQRDAEARQRRQQQQQQQHHHHHHQEPVAVAAAPPPAFAPNSSVSSTDASMRSLPDGGLHSQATTAAPSPERSRRPPPPARNDGGAPDDDGEEEEDIMTTDPLTSDLQYSPSIDVVQKQHTEVMVERGDDSDEELQEQQQHHHHHQQQQQQEEEVDSRARSPIAAAAVSFGKTAIDYFSGHHDENDEEEKKQQQAKPRHDDSSHHHQHHHGSNSKKNKTSSSDRRPSSSSSQQQQKQHPQSAASQLSPEERALRRRWNQERWDALRVLLTGLVLLIGICISCMERDTWMQCGLRTMTRAMRGNRIVAGRRSLIADGDTLTATVGTHVYVGAQGGLFRSCVTASINLTEEGRLLNRWEDNLRHALRTVREGPQRSEDAAILTKKSTGDWILSDSNTILTAVGFNDALPIYQVCNEDIRDHSHCQSANGIDFTFTKIQVIMLLALVGAGILFIGILLDLNLVRACRIKMHKYLLVFCVILIWSLSLSVWVAYADSANVSTDAATTHAECELEANLREVLASFAAATITVSENATRFQAMEAVLKAESRSEFNSTELETLKLMRANLSNVPVDWLSAPVAYFDDCTPGFSLWSWLAAWIIFTLLSLIFFYARIRAHTSDGGSFGWNPVDMLRKQLNDVLDRGVFELAETIAPSPMSGSGSGNVAASGGGFGGGGGSDSDDDNSSQTGGFFETGMRMIAERTLGSLSASGGQQQQQQQQQTNQQSSHSAVDNNGDDDDDDDDGDDVVPLEEEISDGDFNMSLARAPPGVSNYSNNRHSRNRRSDDSWTSGGGGGKNRGRPPGHRPRTSGEAIVQAVGSFVGNKVAEGARFVANRVSPRRRNEQ